MRVAVFRALYLGDLIVSLPALHALRELFPGAEVTLIGLPWAAEIVRRTPAIDRLLAFPSFPGIAEVPQDPAGTEAFLEDVRQAPFDLAIQMHGSGEVSNGFVAALGARATLGYAKGADPRLTVALPWEEERHEVERWLGLVGACRKVGRFEPSNTHIPPLPTTPAERARADALVAGMPGDGPLVALHAGAKDEARRWPARKFAALADALWERFGARVILTGSEAERPITSAVATAARAPVSDLSGLTGLGELIGLIARLDLLVTNDTGASHVASTTRTPSVTLFGPSRPHRWAPPDRTRHHALDALALAAPGADPAEALRALPVEAVLEACERQLALGEEARRDAAPPRR